MSGISSVLTRRLTASGLAAIAAVSMATAACAKSSNSADHGTPSPTPVAPKDALIASVAELGKQSFSFTMKNADSTGHGAVSPERREFRTTAVVVDRQSGVTLTIDLIGIADDSYLKLDFGTLKVPGAPPKDTWQHLDRNKINDPEELAVDIRKDPDPAGIATIFNSIVTVETTGEGRYAGTVDLTKAAKAQLVDEETVEDLGDAAKSVPFEATLDFKGRPATVTIQVPASGPVSAQKWEVAYKTYGVDPSIVTPTDAVEAPQSLYDLLNG